MSALRRSAKVVSLIDETEAPLSALQLNDYPRRQRRDERTPVAVAGASAEGAAVAGMRRGGYPAGKLDVESPHPRASLPIAAPPSRASCGLKLEPIKKRVT